MNWTIPILSNPIVFNKHNSIDDDSRIFYYKKERLDEQIQWHSKKARHNKLRFWLYQIVTLVSSAIIPITNVANIADFQTRIISSIIGGIIAVSTGITQLEKYQENWILYRTSAELLKKDKYSIITVS